jgi:hypothetical protein
MEALVTRNLLISLALCAGAAWSVHGSAQNSYLDFAGGYSRPPTDKDSFAMSLSYARQSRWWRLGLTSDLLMSANESSYYMDGSVCRDGDTGRFADSYLCGPEMDIALRGEAALRIPGTGVSFGPGYRLAVDSGPFGFLQVDLPMHDPSWNWVIRGSGGKNFIQVEAGAAFQFGKPRADSPQP